MIINILIINLVLFMMILASVITNFNQWGVYRDVYNRLQLTEFRSCLGLVMSENESIIWFTEDNTFKLMDGVYLYSRHICMLDPYYLYWWFKYKRWFETNCSHLKK